jgi:molybdate transport system substrate-binding protein
VALGEAPFGITYVTDAAAEPRVSIAALFPETSHPPIRYPAALTQGADDAAAGFLAYLQSETANLAFTSHGFIPLLP